MTLIPIHNGVTFDVEVEGNTYTIASSEHTGECFAFRTAVAAIHWLWIVDAIYESRRNRFQR